MSSLHRAFGVYCSPACTHVQGCLRHLLYCSPAPRMTPRGQATATSCADEVRVQGRTHAGNEHGRLIRTAESKCPAAHLMRPRTRLHSCNHCTMLETLSQHVGNAVTACPPTTHHPPPPLPPPCSRRCHRDAVTACRTTTQYPPPRTTHHHHYHHHYQPCTVYRRPTSLVQCTVQRRENKVGRYSNRQ